jgi:hypothetical protein
MMLLSLGVPRPLNILILIILPIWIRYIQKSEKFTVNAAVVDDDDERWRWTMNDATMCAFYILPPLFAPSSDV